MKQLKDIHSMTTAAVLAAALSVSSFFVIPLPFTAVVLSLQTVMVNLIALMLTPLQSFCCVGVYLLMGVIGLPVFSGGTSGFGKLLGPTGGFYFGFLLSVVVMSFLKGKAVSFKRYLAVTCLAGLPIQHLCAIGVMCFHNNFNLVASFQSVSLPFLLGDIIKCIGACLIAVPVLKNGRRI